MRDQEKAAKPPCSAQTGWCWPRDTIHFLDQTTPSAPSKEAAQRFLGVATPPLLRRGNLCSPLFIHTFSAEGKLPLGL
jgi:hypothetical protein